jgi:hypothetical protein
VLAALPALAVPALAFQLAAASAPPAEPSAQTATEAPARFLVIIGYNGGGRETGSRRPPLSFADDDAARLFLQLAPSSERAYLLSTFDKESARAWPDLTDIARPPTRESLAQVLGEVSWLIRAQKKLGRPTELVFAFAGHGDVTDSGEGFVVLADGPFTRSDLETQVLEPSPADMNHVVIDACSSYFMVQARGSSQSGKVPLTPKLLDVLQHKKRAAALKARTGVIVSTSSATDVHESSELQSGIFSFLLRSALAGAGDTNADGRVEYVEAAAFIAAASAGLADPRARLRVHASAPAQRPHAPLLDLKRSGAEHFLAVQGPARLRVLDARGVPYAEVNTDRPVMLALVGNPFYVVQRGHKEAVLVPRAAGAYALSSLSFEDSPRPRSASPGHTRGLFDAPFDDGFVNGFLARADMAPPLKGPELAVAYAPAGTPPVRLPVRALGIGTLVTAGLVGAGAAGAIVANQLAFDRLRQGLETTGQLDPRLSLEVEGWRSAATGLTLGAVALGLAGGGLYLYSLQLEDGEVELR